MKLGIVNNNTSKSYEIEDFSLSQSIWNKLIKAIEIGSNLHLIIDTARAQLSAACVCLG